MYKSNLEIPIVVTKITVFGISDMNSDIAYTRGGQAP